MRRPALLVALVALPLFACADADPTSPSPSPMTTLSTAPIFDGAHNGGNPHFFFLPPLVKNPQPTGTFNPALAPVVEICALNAAGDACADPQPPGLPLQFTMGGTGPTAIKVSETDQHYSVNWQTSQYALDTSINYRVTVYPVEGGEKLGHIDVDLAANGGRGRSSANDGPLTVQEGSALPIHFRIEQGIACTQAIDCVEAIVGAEGATVTTPSEFAGVEIPPGALDAPVLVSIERVDVRIERCLPTDIIQAEGCYRFDTDPELNEVQESGLNGFNFEVPVGVCFDPIVLALPEHHQYALHKFDPELPELGIVQLPSVAVDFLDCVGFAALGSDGGGPILGIARAGWKRLAPLARLLGPGRAYAVNLGFGGLSKSFSNIGWARGLEFTILSGADQSAPAGATLPVDPAVRVTATHWDPEEFESAPTVQGIEVTFTFTDPAANVTVVSATTNADGVASVPWVLGETPGTNTLEVSGVTLEAVSLSATATDPGIDLAALANEANAAFIYAYGAGKLTGNNLDNVVTASALLSDEVFHSGTFSTRNEFDRRSISVSGNATLLQMYQRLQEARARLAYAGEVLQEAATEAGTNDVRVILLHINEGFAWLAFAENYCSGVPLAALDDGELIYDGQHTTAEMFSAALARFDEAITLIELGGLPDLPFDPRHLALMGRARAFLGLHDLAGAAAAAAEVPTSFGTLMQIDFPIEGEPFTNAFYALNAGQRRISVADGEGGNGLNYRSSDDQRLEFALDPLPGFNGISSQYNLQDYALFGIPLGPTARMPVASGVEARLIQAEAELAAGNVAAATAHVNEARSVFGLAALTGINLNVLFRERAFWLYATGRRLGDMRRLVRQYDRSPEAVFPTGTYPIGEASYGSDMNFPIPQSDISGSFACFDREA